MTTWLRITQIARLTNLSRRYWQRRFARGEVPGARQVQFGQRRLFLADRHQFEAWWARHLLCVSKLTGPQQITALKSRTLKPSSAARAPERRRRRAAPAAVPKYSEQRCFVFLEDRT